MMSLNRRKHRILYFDVLNVLNQNQSNETAVRFGSVRRRLSFPKTGRTFEKNWISTLDLTKKKKISD